MLKDNFPGTLPKGSVPRGWRYFTKEFIAKLLACANPRTRRTKTYSGIDGKAHYYAQPEVHNTALCGAREPVLSDEAQVRNVGPRDFDVRLCEECMRRLANRPEPPPAVAAAKKLA